MLSVSLFTCELIIEVLIWPDQWLFLFILQRQETSESRLYLSTVNKISPNASAQKQKAILKEPKAHLLSQIHRHPLKQQLKSLKPHCWQGGLDSWKWRRVKLSSKQNQIKSIMQMCEKAGLPWENFSRNTDIFWQRESRQFNGFTFLIFYQVCLYGAIHNNENCVSSHLTANKLTPRGEVVLNRQSLANSALAD